MFRKPHLYRQQDQSDCGVSCLLSVIQYYKGSNNIENLRRLSGTGVNGTTLLGLYEAATKVGFNAAGCQASISDLLDHKKPVILHVVLPSNLQHYVVCFNYKINKLGVVQFQIGDPAQGIMYLSEKELNAIWQSKTCLTLEPNARFVTASKGRKDKLLWFFRILREDIPHLGVAAVMGMLIAAMSLSMAIFSQKLIDDFLPGRLSDKIYMGVLLVGVILLIREGISALRQWLLLQQLRSFNSRIVQYFFSRLLQLPMPFFDTRKIGDLTARLNDTTRIQRVVTQIFGTALIEVLLIVVSLIFLFRYSVNIALLTLVFLPFFFGLAYLHRRHVLKRQQQVMQGYALTEANYISTVQGISAIKNHNQQDYFVSLNNQVYGGYQSAILDMGKLQIRISLFVSISSIIFLMLLLTYGSSLVLSGQLKTGELIAIVSLIGSILPGVSGLALLSIPLSEAMVAINRMFEFTSLEIEDERDNEIGTTLMIQSVSIHNLIFRYPGRKPLLKSINLKINRGEMIGLIGENGCGKSTLVQLLLQHYQPETGNVTVNYDKDIHSIPGYIWRKYCSVVPQQVHLFNSSILQNIAFEDAKLNPSEVLAFLDRHGFTPLFKMLPEGINSLVGDEGINLSGGQRQLVGIARALYARPQILILDEATSAMDMETEQFVINLLKKFLPDIGILCITHRLHILKHNCQRIYVMQEGVITINGNHNELMKSANLYSMFWSQMLKEAGDLSI